MGYGSYLVWNECGGFRDDAKLPLSLYGANLALSWAVMPLLSKTKNLGLVCALFVLNLYIIKI